MVAALPDMLLQTRGGDALSALFGDRQDVAGVLAILLDLDAARGRVGLVEGDRRHARAELLDFEDRGAQRFTREGSALTENVVDGLQQQVCRVRVLATEEVHVLGLELGLELLLEFQQFLT